MSYTVPNLKAPRQRDIADMALPILNSLYGSGADFEPAKVASQLVAELRAQMSITTAEATIWEHFARDEASTVRKLRRAHRTRVRNKKAKVDAALSKAMARKTLPN
jgi:hypothetical protein